MNSDLFANPAASDTSAPNGGVTADPEGADPSSWSAERWTEVVDAVRAAVPPSPVLPSDALSRKLGRPVLLKLENLQRTGSFKVRGAAARISRLTDRERASGVVACSSGNHGKAVAWVAGRAGVPAVVCVPDWIDPVKLSAIRGAGAEAGLCGATYDDAAREAARIAAEEGRVFIHPFDDPWVAAGQGTLAVELLDQVPDLAAVVLPLSGGGLAGGVAAALKAGGSAAACVAISAERAQVMHASLLAGRPIELEEEPTLASALSGGIELENQCTFELVRRHVTHHALVPEAAIEEAVLWTLRHERMLVEGGGAVGVAALLTEVLPEIPADGPVVVVLSGGNLDLARLQELHG